MEHEVARINTKTGLEEKKMQRLFKSKGAQALLNEIAQSKSAPLSRVIFGLGIRFVGERTAELLASHYGSMDELAKASAGDLEQVNA